MVRKGWMSPRPGCYHDLQLYDYVDLFYFATLRRMLLASSTPQFLPEKLILNARVCKYSRNTDKKHLYKGYTFPIKPPERCLEIVRGDTNKEVRLSCLL